MSKIAFDCKGTLLGNALCRKLLEDLYKRGHDITIWSSLGSYTIDAREMFPEDWDLQTLLKLTYWDWQDQYNSSPDFEFDYAIDDDMSQTYLAARKLINVRSLCDYDTDESYEAFLKSFDVKPEPINYLER